MARRNGTTQLAMISIFVKDQDEALAFYTEKLGLEKRADVTYGSGLRFVSVAPRGQHKPEIALAKPDETLHSVERIQEIMARIGRRVHYMFDTDDCQRMYETLCERGVKFVSGPTRQLYGVEAIFEDTDGNMFSLLEPSPEARSILKDRRVGTAA